MVDTAILWPIGAGAQHKRNYDGHMRAFAVLVLSAFLHLGWVPGAAAQTQADLPGDRADTVAGELMSPF